MNRSLLVLSLTIAIVPSLPFPLPRVRLRRERYT